MEECSGELTALGPEGMVARPGHSEITVSGLGGAGDRSVCVQGESQATSMA